MSDWKPPETPAKKTLAEQIAEVKRELALRRNVYRNFVARGTLEAKEADDHWSRLHAALQTLLYVERHADAIKAKTGEEAP